MARFTWNAGRRRSPVKRRSFLGVAGLAAVTLAGLASGCIDTAGAPKSRQVPVPDDAPERTTSLKQTPRGARWGGRLVYQQADSPHSLDPHTQESPAAQFAAAPAYNGLLIPWENQPGVQEVQGDLVARWEQPGATEYVFVLEPEARWQNVTPVRGRRFSAADVLYNLERLKGADPRVRTAPFFSPIDAVEAIDAQTVKVRLRHPFAAFLSNLAIAWAAMAPRELVESGQIEQRAVGTGPYIFETWESERSIQYRANPAYFAKGQPFADHLDLRLVRDGAAREQNLVAAEVDGGNLDIVLKSAASVDELRARLEATHPGMSFVESAGFSTTLTLYANLTQPPFNDLRVRQALNAALPHDQMVQLWGGRAAKTGPVAPGNEQWALPTGALPAFDPAKVKQLLTAAGFPEGFRTELWVSKQYNGSEVAPLVQQLLRPYGIQIEVLTLDPSRASSAIFRRAEPYPLTARAAWSFDDPDRTLYEAFHSRGGSEHQGIGEAYPESRALDQLLEAQRQELNREARRNTVLQIQRRLVDDAIQTWLISPGAIAVVPPWVGNPHVMIGGLSTANRLTGTVFLKSGPRSA
jgi:peptide/nickel transport system substrate-binding protein